MSTRCSGNHDATARYILRRLCQEITEENYATALDGELLSALAMWQFDGGQATLDSFKLQSPDERDALLDYLDEFEPYETVEAGGKRLCSCMAASRMISARVRSIDRT